MLERLRRLLRRPRRRGRNAVPVGAEVGAPVLLEEVADLGVDGVLGVHAPLVRSEHVRVGLRAPLGTVVVGPGHRHAGLVRVLGGQEEQRALRDDAERLGVGLLHGGGDLRRVGLVVDDQRHQLVPVHATLGILQGDAGVEAGRRVRVLRRSFTGQVGDVRDGDRRGRRAHCGPGRRGRQRGQHERQSGDRGGHDHADAPTDPNGRCELHLDDSSPDLRSEIPCARHCKRRHSFRRISVPHLVRVVIVTKSKCPWGSELVLLPPPGSGRSPPGPPRRRDRSSPRFPWSG